MNPKEIDDVSGVDTTGHEWDGIKELNNPLPRWWVVTFYATIVWAIAYTAAYPAWPLVASATGGLLGYSSRVEVRNELDAARAAKGDYVAAVQARTVDEILSDDGLRQFASAAGAAAFKVNCIQCHGTGAAGSAGYPNLNDDDWLWGGRPEEIHATIAHGVRFATDDATRLSAMPAFADIFQPTEIRQVALYVRSISGNADTAAQVDKGAELFSQNCAACHGDAGKGNRDLGAPDLTDAIWLYGPSEADIIRQVGTPRHGVMPAWAGRLGETTVKELAVYVHSLGGGE